MKRINIKEIIKNKKYVLIIGIIAFILLAVGATYAYFNWSSNKINTVVSSRCFEIFYEKGNDIEGEIMPSYDYTGGLYSVAKMDINSLCNLDAIGKLYLDVSEETSTNLYREGLLNYQVLKNGELTDIKGSITSAGEIELYLGKLNRNLVATTEYTIYVWIDYDLVNNNDVGSKFIGSIRGEAIQGFEVASGEVMLTENGVTYGGQLIANVGEIDTEEEVAYSYQWYTNTTASNSGGVPIAGATTDTLNLTEETIDQYVYCAVTMSIKNMLPRTVASPVTSTKVSKKNLTITPNAQTVTYGTPISNSLDDIGATGLAFGDRIATGTVTQNKTTAGTGTISASGVTIVDSEDNDVTSNYNLSYSTGVLTINKKDASITPSAQTITYGDSLTSTTEKVSTTGLLASDSISSVSLSPSTTNAGTGTVNVSSVSIKDSSGTDVTGSYNITNNTGVLTVNKKAATITASAQTIIYGSSITNATSKISSSGILASDSVSAVTLSASRSTAGSGTVTPSAAVIKNAGGDDVTSNYDIKYYNGTLTIGKKGVIITAKNQTMKYNGSITKDLSMVSNSGLVFNDKLSDITLSSEITKSVGTSTLGEGNIIPSMAKIVNSAGTDVTDNYSIAYKNGTALYEANNCVINIYNCSSDSQISVSAGSSSSSVFSSSTSPQIDFCARCSWAGGFGNITLQGALGYTQPTNLSFNEAKFVVQHISGSGAARYLNFDCRSAVDTTKSCSMSVRFSWTKYY